jgi:hypothetical protein
MDLPVPAAGYELVRVLGVVHNAEHCARRGYMFFCSVFCKGTMIPSLQHMFNVAGLKKMISLRRETFFAIAMMR